MRTKFFVLPLLMGSLVLAQETIVTKPAPVANEVKVVNVKSDASELTRLACDPSVVACQPGRALRAVVVRGTALDVANTERTILQLDGLTEHLDETAGKDVETTIFVIAASSDGIPGVEEVNGEQLSPVVKQLRAIFPYSHYQLLSTMLLRSAQGAGALTGGLLRNTLNEADILQPADYSISYGEVKASHENTHSFMFKNFDFKAGVPVAAGKAPNQVQYQRGSLTIHVDANVREGQKTVIGKTNLGNSDRCLFVVLSARLVQ